MNPNISVLYAAIHNNRVVVIESNLQSFVDQLKEKFPSSRNYMWHNREFKKSDYFKVDLEGKEYYFQKLL